MFVRWRLSWSEARRCRVRICAGESCDPGAEPGSSPPPKPPATALGLLGAIPGDLSLCPCPHPSQQSPGSRDGILSTGLPAERVHWAASVRSQGARWLLSQPQPWPHRSSSRDLPAALFPGSEALGPLTSLRTGQPVPSLPPPTPAPALVRVPCQDCVPVQLRLGPVLPTGLSLRLRGKHCRHSHGAWERGLARCRDPREIFSWRNKELLLHPQHLAPSGPCKSALGSRAGLLR